MNLHRDHHPRQRRLLFDLCSQICRCGEKRPGRKAMAVCLLLFHFRPLDLHVEFPLCLSPIRQAPFMPNGGMQQLDVW